MTLDLEAWIKAKKEWLLAAPTPTEAVAIFHAGQMELLADLEIFVTTGSDVKETLEELDKGNESGC